MNIENFGTDEKREIQKILSSQVIINGQKYFIQDAIRIYTKSLLDALDSEDFSNLRLYENEL